MIRQIKNIYAELQEIRHLYKTFLKHSGICQVCRTPVIPLKDHSIWYAMS